MATLVVQTSSVVKVNVTTAESSFTNERRFDKSLTVAKLKEKLEMITGCSAGSMKLEVFSNDNKSLFSLDSPDSLIGSYQIDDGMRLHVTDTNPTNFGDITTVEKFELPDKKYEERSDSVRSFLKQNKMGQYNPDQKQVDEEAVAKKEADEKKAMEEIQVGSRCEVRMPKQPPRRGKVEYVGYTDFRPDLWVGIAYDEPCGKHDGTVQGKQYFSCAQGYGSFVRHKHVKCGDFPELDIEDDEM